MLTKTDIEIIKKLLEGFVTKDDLFGSEKRLKNDILIFKDQILSEIIKLRDDLTMVEGWRQMMADQEEEIEKIKAVIHL